MQQILKETKIKYIYFIDQNSFPTYEKTNNKELLISNNLFITNPLVYKSGVQILDYDSLTFKTLSTDVNYIEILSEDYFYVRINNDFILRTKSFNYYNAEQSLDLIEVLNGDLIIENNNIISGSNNTDVKIEFVVANGI